jgi:hypothetical protein
MLRIAIQAGGHRVDDFARSIHNPASAESFLIVQAAGNFSVFSRYLTAVLFLRKLAALLGRP